MQTDYWHALDKQAAKNLQVNPKIIGISHGIGDVAKGLKANVFAGASTVELGFMGVAKGSRSTPTGVTPELYGKTEREDMRLMAKVNDIKVTTHATANIQGFAGLDPQKGGFKDAKKEEALHEVERAIDFAADVAGGGPVVVHTGEYERPIYEADPKFKAYRDEPEKAPIYFVDKRTGDLRGIDRDKEIPFAVKDEKGEYKRDSKTGELQVEMRNYNYIEKEFNKLSAKDKADFDNHPEKYFFNEMKGEEVNRYRAEAEHFDRQARLLKEKADDLNQLKEYYEEGKTQEYKKGIIKLAEQKELGPGEMQLLTENPQKYFKEKIPDLQRMKSYYEEGAVGYKKASKSAKAEVEAIIPIEDYAVKRSASTIAEAAVTAYDREKKQKLKKFQDNFL